MTKRPPQFRIVETLRMMEMLTGNIQYLKELKEESMKHLDDACSTFLQGADDDQKSELVRFLYWHSSLNASTIQELTGKSAKQLSTISGPLCFMAQCVTCGSDYTARKASRSADYDQQCDICSNKERIRAHKAFLLDWEEVDHLPDSIDKQGYAAYLNSSSWKAKRKIALKRAGYRCQLCSQAQTRLEVHHNSYERLGKEELEDLCVLCNSCHKKHHNIE